jgi:hypothetical protein
MELLDAGRRQTKLMAGPQRLPRVINKGRVVLWRLFRSSSKPARRRPAEPGDEAVPDVVLFFGARPEDK